jgi:hypothetical protein
LLIFNINLAENGGGMVFPRWGRALFPKQANRKFSIPRAFLGVTTASVNALRDNSERFSEAVLAARKNT